MRLLLLAAIGCSCVPPDGGPLRRTGTCFAWPELDRSAAPVTVLDETKVLLPIGRKVERTISFTSAPCADPSRVRLGLSDAGAMASLVSVGTEDGGTILSARLEIEAQQPGTIDLSVDFGDGLAQERWYAVEERPTLVADPLAVLVGIDGTIRMGSRALGQVPPRAFAIGRVVWSHASQLESWVVSMDGGVASRGVFALDGSWSVSSASESTIVAVRPGSAVEIVFEDGGYRSEPIAVDAAAQDPLAKVNGRWLHYRQAVSPTPAMFITQFTGGRLCELDGGCSSGSFYLSHVRSDGFVVVPPTLDQFQLRDGPGPVKATLDFPAASMVALLQPMGGVEGEGSPVIGRGFVLVPEFTGTPRLLFYPAPVRTNLFFPKLTRDWFGEQSVGYLR